MPVRYRGTATMSAGEHGDYVGRLRNSVGILRGRSVKHNIWVLETLALRGPFTRVELAKERAREGRKNGRITRRDTESKTTTVYRRVDVLLRKGYIQQAGTRPWRSFYSPPTYAITFKSLWLLVAISKRVFDDFNNVWERHADLFRNENPPQGWGDRPFIFRFPIDLTVRGQTYQLREIWKASMEIWPKFSDRLKDRIREKVAETISQMKDFDETQHLELNQKLTNAGEELIDQYLKEHGLNLTEDQRLLASKLGLLELAPIILRQLVSGLSRMKLELLG